MSFSFLVSKARGPGDLPVALVGHYSPPSQPGPTELVAIDLQDEAQMWVRDFRVPSDPRAFGIRNRKFGSWLYPRPVGGTQHTYIEMTSPGSGFPGDLALWYDDNVSGPYNALAWRVDWEKKINMAGDPPYKAPRGAILWRWCGAAENELWRFWPATGRPGAGSRVLLTNFEHIVQLGATPERTVYMHANKDTWEIWSIEDAGGGLVYLRSAHGTYLGSLGNGTVYLTPNRDAWERWVLTTDDCVRLRSAQWGLNLGSRPDGSVYTHANRLQWERWWMTHV